MHPLYSIFLVVTINVSGQLLIKKGLNGLRDIDFSSRAFMSYLNIFGSPYVVAGCLSYFISMLLWLYALSKVNLSFAYPFLALGYVLVMLTSWYFLGESIPTLRWIGVLVICFGIFLVSKS